MSNIEMQFYDTVNSKVGHNVRSSGQRRKEISSSGNQMHEMFIEPVGETSIVEAGTIIYDEHQMRRYEPRKRIKFAENLI
jgi:hypothetical protein